VCQFGARFNCPDIQLFFNSRLEVSSVMGCWKWFNSVLKEAGVTVTSQNRTKIDQVIHKHIGEHSQYEHCSAEWMTAGKKVKMDEKEKKKLIEAVKAAVK